MDRLLDRGDSVIVVDNFFTGKKENVMHHFGSPNFELIRHDVVEPLLLEVDQIYHLACPASPVHYKFNPIKTIISYSIDDFSSFSFENLFFSLVDWSRLLAMKISLLTRNIHPRVRSFVIKNLSFLGVFIRLRVGCEFLFLQDKKKIYTLRRIFFPLFYFYKKKSRFFFELLGFFLPICDLSDKSFAFLSIPQLHFFFFSSKFVHFCILLSLVYGYLSMEHLLPPQKTKKNTLLITKIVIISL